MIRILIVEDERILAITTSMHLEKAGYCVLDILDSGEEAVEYALREKPDIILMDIILQGEISGIDAVKRISTESNAKIIYTTAHSDASTVEAAKNTRNSGFLFKPYDRNELLEILDRAISSDVA